MKTQNGIALILADGIPKNPLMCMSPVKNIKDRPLYAFAVYPSPDKKWAILQFIRMNGKLMLSKATLTIAIDYSPLADPNRLKWESPKTQPDGTQVSLNAPQGTVISDDTVAPLEDNLPLKFAYAPQDQVGLVDMSVNLATPSVPIDDSENLLACSQAMWDGLAAPPAGTK